MYDLIERNTKLILLPVLAVISAAVLFHGSGYIQNGWGRAPVGDPNAVPALICSYVLLLFAAFTTNTSKRLPLIVLGSLSLLLGSIPNQIRTFEFRGEFYEFTNYDYWHIITLILLMLVISGLLIVSSWNLFISARNQVIEFVKNLYSGDNKVVSITLATPIVVLAIFQLEKIWNVISGGFRLRKALINGYQSIGDYSYELFFQITQSFLYVLIALIGIAFIQPVLIKWIEVALGWNEILKEFSMNSYLTRKISSVLYGASYILISAAVGVIVPIYLYDYFDIRDEFFAIGFLSPIIIFPIFALVALAIWFLSLLIIRLAYEFTNAVIHIAENTHKGK